jgi:hypothetical protein
LISGRAIKLVAKILSGLAKLLWPREGIQRWESDKESKNGAGTFLHNIYTEICNDAPALFFRSKKSGPMVVCKGPE